MLKARLPATAEAVPLQGTPLPLDSSLIFKLVRVVNLTARPFLAGMGKTHRLTLNEWRVMVVLASHPGSAATDIAEATGLDKMSVSRALSGLRQQARVLLRSDSNDQRRSHVSLSAAGRKLFALIGSHAMEREAELFNGVSAQELSAMGSTLDKLVLALTASEAK